MVSGKAEQVSLNRIVVTALSMLASLKDACVEHLGLSFLSLLAN